MIYLDNASTTPCLESSAEILKQALLESYYNPSAKYKPAVESNKQLDASRTEILRLVGANPSEYAVVFTGSATEANNLVLNSSFNKHRENIISVGEHSSVYETAKSLANNGYRLVEVGLNSAGELDIDDFKSRMNKDVAFVSVMIVSNETGAINDLKTITKIAKTINPQCLVHADAVQAFCKIKINLSELGVDYLTISAHKIHGPKGVGALIYNKKCKLNPHILGGGQEMGKRSGTENLPAILALVNSAKIMHSQLAENFDLVKTFKLNLLACIKKYAAENSLELVVNGDPESSSPYILSIGFIGTKGEVLLHSLESEGVLVGTGSACNSKHSGNRTLSGMGRKNREVETNIRLSFSPESVSVDPESLAKLIVLLAKKHNSK